MSAQPVTRIGDTGIGVCYLHDTPQPYVTTFIEGAVSAYSDGKLIMTVGGIGMATCGHMTIAETGSGLSVANDKGLHRVGDVGSTPNGPYVAATGSSFVTSL